MPSEEETRRLLQLIAKSLDGLLNGDARAGEKENGFVLLVFPFRAHEGTRTNYVSNADRADMLIALKEIVARFEGRVQETGTQQ